MTTPNPIPPAFIQALRCDQWLAALDELNIGAFSVNTHHRITAINYSAQALIGLHTEEVLERDCREVFTGVPCMAACVVGRNGRLRHDETDIEVRDETDGKHLITRMATPIYDPNQNIVGCLTILQDHAPITHLVDRLHHEERNLKYILDSLDIGIFTVNRGGLVTFFNTAAERMSGYMRQQILGRPCTTLFESKSDTGVCCITEAMQNGESGCDHMGHIIHADGVSIPVRASYMALRNEKGSIVGGLATLQDLTLIHQLSQALNDRYTFHDMIGKSPRMQKIFDRVQVVAQSDATVLIEGATGTGKDLLASVMHSASPRAKRPMVKVSCAAIPENLLESEIFGYVKGAFTGAERDKPGRFQEADGGTIFLDEIGDLPLTLQAKLLRVLEEREFYPLGSRRTRKVDVRIITATNRGLKHLVGMRQFREDLFYRINVVRFELPLLRQRRDDIPLLIRHILRKLCTARNRRVPGISENALHLMLNFRYPGNVRELENILEHALIICQNHQIRRRHLPDYLLDQSVQTPVPTLSANDTDGLPHEAQRIVHTLQAQDGHRGRTARILGMDRTTLWRKMKRYRLLKK